MAQRQIFKRYWAGWASAIGATLLAFCPTATLAQISGDGSLGTQVNGNLTIPCTGICSITNGSTRGSNLFHSLRQFSLPDPTDSADFVITPTIQNVIVRVTGIGQPFISNINGLIQTSNPANFFLLNPNGIIFGSGAALNIGGSFQATTAERMLFQDGTQFSTTDPAPLLTVSIPAGLQPGTPQGSGSIQLQNSSLLAGVGNSFGDITLIGNAVSLNNTAIETSGNGGNIKIQANSLRIENNSVLRTTPLGQGRSGNINLQVDGDLSILDSRIFSELEFGQTGSGGDIQIQAGSLFVRSFTRLDGGQAFITTASSGIGNAGNILIQARDIVSLDRSFISSNLNFNAVGQGGNITIEAGSVSLTTGAFINNNTFGTGDGGNLTVRAREVISLANGSSLSSGVEGLASGQFRDAVGNGGTIRVAAQGLDLTQGSQLKTSTAGQGKAGAIQVITANSVLIDGIDQFGNTSGLLSSVAPGAVGKSGNITVSTDSLSITNGGIISASLGGDGRPGSIAIDARDNVFIDGFGIYRFSEQYLGVSRSGIFNLIDTQGKVIEASGEAGKESIVINTGSLRISNSGGLSSSTFGEGDAGDVIINAVDQVSLAGGTFSSGTNVSSGVAQTGRGKGGNIRITTSSLLATNGAGLAASTDGQGDAGNVIIDARDLVSFDNSSGAFSAVRETGRGRGGDIHVTARIVSLRSGGELSASTFGQGKAGNIFVNARDGVSLDSVGNDGFSSGLFTITERGATGSGGNITTNSASFQVTNGATVNARTNNANDGGSITITADTFNALNGGQIITTTRSGGRAGDINLYVADQIVLADRDATYGDRLTRFGIGVIDNEGSASGLFANTTPGSSGNGGSIFIAPRTVTIRDGARIAVDSQGSGQGGNIQIQAGRLTLDNQGAISAETASNQGGNIALNLQDWLLLRQGSQISTTAGTAQADGNGGNIQINAPLIVAVPRENSDIKANAFTGAGGRVEISADSILGIQPRPVLTPLSDITASSNFGVQGVVAINTPDVDPSRGLVPLPTNLVDPSSQIAQGCSPNSPLTPSRFVATGRGGLPDSPDDALSSDTTLTRLTAPVSRSTTSTNHSDTPSGQPIVEAQGFIRLSDGKIRFVAQAMDVSPHRNWQTAPRCDSSAHRLQTAP